MSAKTHSEGRYRGILQRGGVRYTLILLMALSVSVEARTVIRQNFPGTQWKDYTQPEMVLDNDGQIYQTLPGGLGRDIVAPNYYREGNTIYQEALPGIKSRSYSDPTYTIEEEGDW